MATAHVVGTGSFLLVASGRELAVVGFVIAGDIKSVRPAIVGVGEPLASVATSVIIVVDTGGRTSGEGGDGAKMTELMVHDGHLLEQGFVGGHEVCHH